MPNMGIGFASSVVFKRQNRFLMYIPDITHRGAVGSLRFLTDVLIEEKSARPKLKFKEFDIPHLAETIWFADRPEWNPITVTLYDVAETNPAWEWITKIYNIRNEGGDIKMNFYGSLYSNFKRNVKIFMLDGCGYAMEAWTYMNAFPTDIDFGEVDMGQNNAMKVTMTLRYDRAYWEKCTKEVIGLASSLMFPENEPDAIGSVPGFIIPNELEPPI